MSLGKGNTTAQLLIEVAKNVEVFGEKRTHDILYQERTKSQFAKHVNFVIDIVCDSLSVSSEQVINNKDRHNSKRIRAIKFISYYCYESFSAYGLTFDYIAQRLNRRHAIIMRHHLEMIEKRKDWSKENKTIQNLFKDFDLKIKNYLSKIKKIR